MQRSGRYTFCAVVHIPAGVSLDDQILFEFGLRRSTHRYLTREANLVFENSYRKFPVRSEVPYSKYLAQHASHYCDGRINDSHSVFPCSDTPPFALTIVTRTVEDLTSFDYFLKLWPLAALTVIFIAIVVMDATIK